MDEREFRVIVVDDEKLIARNIAANIERTNPAFRVVELAYDGESAFELVRRHIPDAVFSDIKMPMQDGLTLLRNINLHFPAVQVVMVSGYNDFELVRTALQQSAADYLLKPIHPDELARTLQKLEAQLRARRQDLSAAESGTPAEIVEGVLAYLRRHYAENIEFSQLAEAHHCSPAYLSKIFKDHVGMSPSRYRNEFRINVAKKLLIDTELSIRAIAEQTGFADPFHFSKSFKSIEGCSPAQFREAHTA